MKLFVNGVDVVRNGTFKPPSLSRLLIPVVAKMFFVVITLILESLFLINNQYLGDHMAYHCTIQNIVEFLQHVSPGILVYLKQIYQNLEYAVANSRISLTFIKVFLCFIDKLHKRTRPILHSRMLFVVKQ